VPPDSKIIEYGRNRSRIWPFVRAMLLAITSIAVLMLVVVFWRRWYVEDQWRRKVCQNHLRTLHSLLELYTMENGDTYPPSLTILRNSAAVGDEVTACPGAKSSVKTIPTPDGYEYIDWSTQPRGSDWASEKYPLLYDRRASHHGSSGVYVVLVDGTVFWDRGGQWLKGFAAAHSDAKIPLP